MKKLITLCSLALAISIIPSAVACEGKKKVRRTTTLAPVGECIVRERVSFRPIVTTRTYFRTWPVRRVALAPVGEYIGGRTYCPTVSTRTFIRTTPVRRVTLAPVGEYIVRQPSYTRTFMPIRRSYWVPSYYSNGCLIGSSWRY